MTGVRDRISGEDQAVSTVIGFVLIFGILVVSFSVYQATVVPQQNEDVEFEQQQSVQSDLIELSSSLLDVRSGDREGSVSEHPPVSVQLGTSYPSRAVAVNPPPPQVSLRSQQYGSINITNATVDDSRVDGTLRGDPESTLLGAEHETRSLVYEADYNQYQEAPTTTFEHSMLYNEFRDTNLPVTDQRLVRNGTRQLNIILFDGEVSESGFETRLEPVTLDGPTTEVPIEPDGGNISLVLPTRTPSVWTQEGVFGRSFGEGPSRVRATETGEREVTVTLKSGDWTLQMAQVGYDGGERGETFSAVRENSPGRSQNGTTNGPKVRLDTDDAGQATAGEQISLSSLGGTVTSVGSEGRQRSATPIKEIRYGATGPGDDRSGVIEQFDTDQSSRTIDLSNQDGTIDTTGWELGNHTVTIRAQDSAGFVSLGSDTDEFTVEITEQGPFADLRATDLIANQKQSQTFSIDLSANLEQGDQFTLNLSGTNSSVDYPGAKGQYNVDSGTGSVVSADGETVEYEAGASDGAGDTINITVKNGQGVDVGEAYGEQPVRVSNPDGSLGTEFLVREQGDFGPDDYVEGDDIYVTGDVTVPQDERYGKIDALGDVELKENTTTGGITGGGDVTLKSDTDAGDITSGGGVTVGQDSDVDTVDADGDVTLKQNTMTDLITAGGDVTLKSDTDAGDITSGGDVTVGQNAGISTVDADGDVEIKSGSSSGSVTSDGNVKAKSDVQIAGDINTTGGSGGVTLNDGVVVDGDVFVPNEDSLTCKGTVRINGQSCSEYKNDNY
jgi:hypothetical protein